MELYKGPTRKMAFIIVSKRINTRSFTGNVSNQPSSTLVDYCITLPER